MVKRSSSPCVGWACRPSPAFTTCSCGLTWRAIRKGAPDESCRTTKISACIAERLATVSSKDSPFDWDDTAMLRLMTSAESRLAAISKVVRVRVEGSKNRLKTLLPRSSGTFFTSRSVTPAKDSAVSRICSRISRGSPSMDSRCCSSPFSLSCGLRCTVGLQGEDELARGLALQPQALALGHLDFRADVLGADRQLPAAAVGEHDQRDARRPAVVEQLVHRPAHGAAAEQHVVHQQQLRAVHVVGELGALRVVPQAARRVVVAVERDVHQTQWLFNSQFLMEALREPRAPGVQTDHSGLWSNERLQHARKPLAEIFSVRQLGQSIAPGSIAPRRNRSLSVSRRAAGSPPRPR